MKGRLEDWPVLESSVFKAETQLSIKSEKFQIYETLGIQTEHR